MCSGLESCSDWLSIFSRMGEHSALDSKNIRSTRAEACYHRWLDCQLMLICRFIFCYQHQFPHRHNVWARCDENNQHISIVRVFDRADATRETDLGGHNILADRCNYFSIWNSILLVHQQQLPLLSTSWLSHVNLGYYCKFLPARVASATCWSPAI